MFSLATHRVGSWLSFSECPVPVKLVAYAEMIELLIWGPGLSFLKDAILFNSK